MILVFASSFLVTRNIFSGEAWAWCGGNREPCLALMGTSDREQASLMAGLLIKTPKMEKKLIFNSVLKAYVICFFGCTLRHKREIRVWNISLRRTHYIVIDLKC